MDDKATRELSSILSTEKPIHEGIVATYEPICNSESRGQRLAGACDSSKDFQFLVKRTTCSLRANPSVSI